MLTFLARKMLINITDAALGGGDVCIPMTLLANEMFAYPKTLLAGETFAYQ